MTSTASSDRDLDRGPDRERDRDRDRDPEPDRDRDRDRDPERDCDCDCDCDREITSRARLSRALAVQNDRSRLELRAFAIAASPRWGEEAAMANDNSFRFQQLDIYRTALELAAVVHSARIGDAELRDQATRAAKSVFLNVCEGLPSDAPGIRRRHFGAANGSLHEVVGALDLARAIGAVAPEPAGRALALALRVKRMLRALSGGARAA